MKKILLVNLFSVFTFSAIAQIANGGFEEWTTKGTYEEPNGWATLNIYSAFGAPITASKSTDKQSGSYSLKLETKAFANPLTGMLDTLPGLAVTSKVIFLNEEPKGFPYTQRPTSLNGFFKYTPLKNDEGGMLVYLTKWNATTKKTDTIGGGGYAFKSAMVNFTPISLPLIYSASTAMPDSAIILLIASDPDKKPIPGTVLFADDIVFMVPNENETAYNVDRQIVLYPNPAIGEASIKNIPANVNAVEITDFTGRLIDKVIVEAGTCNIVTSQYSSGMYFYNLLEAQGASVQKGKFSVLK